MCTQTCSLSVILAHDKLREFFQRKTRNVQQKAKRKAKPTLWTQTPQRVALKAGSHYAFTGHNLVINLLFSSQLFF